MLVAKSQVIKIVIYLWPTRLKQVVSPNTYANKVHFVAFERHQPTSRILFIDIFEVIDSKIRVMLLANTSTKKSKWPLSLAHF